MKLSYDESIDGIRKQAQSMLDQADALEKLLDMEIPGRFVFSPPSSRLCVASLEELHAARKVLRERFDWKDDLANKFFSCGAVIVTYRPRDYVKTPLPFELWVEAPPESFPEKLLGGCRVEKYERADYAIVCPA